MLSVYSKVLFIFIHDNPACRTLITASFFNQKQIYSSSRQTSRRQQQRGPVNFWQLCRVLRIVSSKHCIDQRGRHRSLHGDTRADGI